MAGEIGKLFFTLAGRFQGQAFKQLDKSVSKSTKNLKGMSASVRSSFLNLNNVLAGVSIGLIGKDLVDVALNLDRVETRFKTITGSIEKSNLYMNKASNTANRYGLELNTVREGMSQFMAASMGTFELEESAGMYEKISAAVAGLRMSAGEAKGTLLAFSQMISKGKIQAEELRRQLANALPGAVPLVAKALNMTTAELDKALKEGRITIKDFTKIVETLYDRFGKNADKTTQSVIANTNKMSNSFIGFKEAIVKGGLNDVLLDITVGLSKAFNAKDAKEFGLKIGKSIKTIYNVIKKITKFVIWGLKTISVLIIALGLNLLITNLNTILRITNILFARKLIPYLKTISGLLWSMMIPLAEALLIIGGTLLILDAIETAWSAIKGEYEEIDSLTKRILDKWSSMDDNIKKMGNSIEKNILKPIRELLTNMGFLSDKAKIDFLTDKKAQEEFSARMRSKQMTIKSAPTLMDRIGSSISNINPFNQNNTVNIENYGINDPNAIAQQISNSVPNIFGSPEYSKALSSGG